jgi:S-adenosylmethionine synthetase
MNPATEGKPKLSRYTFTSESVTEGHPDKLADQISDTILDTLLTRDPGARVAVETLVAHRTVHVAGEITTTARIDIEEIVRGFLIGIGYDSIESGMDGASCDVITDIVPQDPDIAAAVGTSYEVREDGSGEVLDSQGAGDQGLMFGYACDETAAMMPLPIHLAHRLASRLASARRTGLMPYLGPTGKTQVTVEYDGHEPVRIDTVVVSTHNYLGASQRELLRSEVMQHVIAPELGGISVSIRNCRFLINPHNDFNTGGPAADCGLTGRKIIVDTYGGAARHGGGAFSGKDPTKVDRSGAYALRWIAKNVVAAGLARRCELQVSYAIGTARPISLFADCFGTEVVPISVLRTAILKVFDLRPAAIIRDLDLCRPVYAATASYGHFGRDLPEFTWEQVNRIVELRAAIRAAAADQASVLPPSA